MDKEGLIELTKNLYRITLLFPKKEPLRYKMREMAIDILVDLAALNFENKDAYSAFRFAAVAGSDGVILNLESLDAFFGVALAQNWAKQDEVLAMREKYGNLKDTLEKEISESPAFFSALKKVSRENRQETEIVKNDPVLEGTLPRQNSERKERIIEFLKENGRVQVWQVKQILPDVSKRTLRRDFEQMLGQGVVERGGERNNTFYQLK